MNSAVLGLILMALSGSPASADSSLCAVFADDGVTCLVPLEPKVQVQIPVVEKPAPPPSVVRLKPPPSTNTLMPGAAPQCALGQRTKNTSEAKELFNQLFGFNCIGKTFAGNMRDDQKKTTTEQTFGLRNNGGELQVTYNGAPISAAVCQDGDSVRVFILYSTFTTFYVSASPLQKGKPKMQLVETDSQGNSAGVHGIFTVQ